MKIVVSRGESGEIVRKSFILFTAVLLVILFFLMGIELDTAVIWSVIKSPVGPAIGMDGVTRFPAFDRIRNWHVSDCSQKADGQGAFLPIEIVEACLSSERLPVIVYAKAGNLASKPLEVERFSQLEVDIRDVIEGRIGLIGRFHQCEARVKYRGQRDE